jgi:hypothetical protein
LIFLNVTDFKLSWVNNLKEDKVDRPGRLYLFDKCHLSCQKQYLNNQKDVFKTSNILECYFRMWNLAMFD